jgi:DNA-binding PadR family transcriptional regulator
VGEPLVERNSALVSKLSGPAKQVLKHPLQAKACSATRGPRELLCYSTARNRLSKTKIESEFYNDDRDLYSGLIRLHILHHAAEEPIFGLGMLEELARHGYRISPGTLYPLLHGLEKKGYLKASEERNGKSMRKVYKATKQGKKALAAAKSKVRELFGELIEGK